MTKRAGISLLLSRALSSISFTAYIFPKTEWAHFSLNGNIVFAVHFRTRKCLPQLLVQEGPSQAAQCSGKCQSSLFRGNTHGRNFVCQGCPHYSRCQDCAFLLQKHKNIHLAAQWKKGESENEFMEIEGE